MRKEERNSREGELFISREGRPPCSPISSFLPELKIISRTARRPSLPGIDEHQRKIALFDGPLGDRTLLPPIHHSAIPLRQKNNHELRTILPGPHGPRMLKIET